LLYAEKDYTLTTFPFTIILSRLGLCYSPTSNKHSKKKQSIDALAQLSDTLSWYHRNIKFNKQILSDLDKKVNQKQHVKEVH
jgi:hypothetical protein